MCIPLPKVSLCWLSINPCSFWSKIKVWAHLFFTKAKKEDKPYKYSIKYENIALKYFNCSFSINTNPLISVSINPASQKQIHMLFQYMLYYAIHQINHILCMKKACILICKMFKTSFKYCCLLSSFSDHHFLQIILKFRLFYHTLKLENTYFLALTSKLHKKKFLNI